MSEPKMSKGALMAKRHYFNVERWENKAKKKYGKKYIPAKDGETISAQAVELRREYQREYNKKHPEKNRDAKIRFWERKAKEYNY